MGSVFLGTTEPRQAFSQFLRDVCIDVVAARLCDIH